MPHSPYWTPERVDRDLYDLAVEIDELRDRLKDIYQNDPRGLVPVKNFIGTTSRRLRRFVDYAEEPPLKEAQQRRDSYGA